MGQTPRPVADLGSRRKTKRVHYELPAADAVLTNVGELLSQIFARRG